MKYLVLFGEEWTEVKPVNEVMDGSLLYIQAGRLAKAQANRWQKQRTEDLAKTK